MKKIITISLAMLLIVGCMACLSGCGTDPVEEDLIAYTNSGISDALKDCSSISTEGQKVFELDTNEAMVAQLNNNVIPLVEDANKIVKGIKPETEEVKAIHDKLVACVEKYQTALNNLKSAIEKDDVDAATKSLELLNEGTALMQEFNDAYTTLASQYGLTK